MENLEIEFKVIINKEDFHKLEKIMEEYEYELFEQVNIKPFTFEICNLVKFILFTLWKY